MDPVTIVMLAETTDLTTDLGSSMGQRDLSTDAVVYINPTAS
jgi:hypothetical protein